MGAPNSSSWYSEAHAGERTVERQLDGGRLNFVVVTKVRLNAHPVEGRIAAQGSPLPIRAAQDHWQQKQCGSDPAAAYARELARASPYFCRWLSDRPTQEAGEPTTCKKEVRRCESACYTKGELNNLRISAKYATLAVTTAACKCMYCRTGGPHGTKSEAHGIVLAADLRCVRVDASI
eukprot:scaffold48394_cov32-Tisochrysis_lutea.AAC.1